jgi:hydrophobe/amphiphile efflux-1 (HAE1) family protein
MNLPHFFIDHPRFAVVVSLVIMIVGGISLGHLPVAQYPEVAPPTVVVRTSYPGATPEVIADTVAAPIEQEINGVENMLYMSSQSTADGALAISVTFKLGTNLDTAQVLVQNRVAIAEARLPEEVRRIGLTVTKSSPDLLMVVQMFSPDGSRDRLYVSNYALLQVRERLRRVDGVGEVRLFGAREYNIRVWLDPDRLSALDLAADDVVAALREQNVQVAAGVIGQQPAPEGRAFQVNISALGRLSTIEEFDDIIVKTGSAEEVVRLRDVARVELGAQDYGVNNYASRTPAVAMPIDQRPGSNALETSRAIRSAMADMKKSFPPGVDYAIIYDPTQFISESVEAVEHTLYEAIFLVVIVVMVFLQNWRAAVIPLIAIPVSVIGTFFAMDLLGFTLNNLTLFGLVLSIGIVVDDAIVVVENIERHLEEGLSPREAARTAMDEVRGPILATALVMIGIFIPTAFIPGLSGQFYRQFALTIAGSVSISTLVSLSLSPAMGAFLLRPHHAKPDAFTRVWNFLFGWFFTAFNWVFDRFTLGYAGLVRRLVRLSFIGLFVYGGLLALTWLGFTKIPGGFVPQQDQGYGIMVAQLPPGASLARTDAVVQALTEKALSVEGVAHTVSFAGFNGATFTNNPNSAAIFTTFAPFEERVKKGRTADAIIADLRRAAAGTQEAYVFIIPPPPLRGIGNGGGFKMIVQDRAGLGYQALEEAAFKLMAAANRQPEIVQAFTPFNAGSPRFHAEIDRTRAKLLDVPLGSVFSALQIYFGSIYVNDVNLFGRTYRVTAQADQKFRDDASDLLRLKTRSKRGEIVPLGSLVSLKDTSGPDRVFRYNLYPGAELQGSTAPGYSTGQSIAAMERLAAEILPPGMGYEWTELAYQEKNARGSAGVFALAVLFVFLVLVAQYESWSLPLAVILIVPMCLAGAVGLLLFRGMDNNILSQIAFIVLIGLAAKNAILIVEFAKHQQDLGKTRFEAAIEAARLRLRPILMTSFAFILGVVPLMIAHGPGAEMRQSLGTTVFGGMLGVTFLGIFLTPVFYVLVMKYVKGRPAPAAHSPVSRPEMHPGGAVLLQNPPLPHS